MPVTRANVIARVTGTCSSSAHRLIFVVRIICTRGCFYDLIKVQPGTGAAGIRGIMGKEVMSYDHN